MLNGLKNNFKKGFTMIEVMLFIAISGMVLIGVMAGSGANIARQRYKDSTQDFAEFLRQTYSSALYVENNRKDPIGSNDICNIWDTQKIKEFNGFKKDSLSGANDSTSIFSGLAGRTNCAYYGKYITFNEKNDEVYTVRTYDLVGKIYTPDIDKRLTIDEAIKTQVLPEVLGVFPKKDNNNTCLIRPIQSSFYTLKWGASLQTKDSNQFKKMDGSILIIRSPEDNRLRTLFSRSSLKIADIKDEISCSEFNVDNYKTKSIMKKFNNTSDQEKFYDDKLNICINSDDIFFFGQTKREIMLTSDISNPSSIDLLPEDSEHAKCR